MPDTLAKDDLIDFLQQPLVKSLLAIHPNDILASEEFRCPDTWKPWWTWAAALSPDGEPPWISLLHVARDHSESSLDEEHKISAYIPSALSDLVNAATHLQLNRTPVNWSAQNKDSISVTASNDTLHSSHPTGPSSRQVAWTQMSVHRLSPLSDNANVKRVPSGMSPKKAHEVSRMSSYIYHLVSSSPALGGVKHVVDVGAGQGYLSRALRDLGFHVLALDGSVIQTSGAEQRLTKEQAKGVKRQWSEQEASPTSSVTDIYSLEAGSLTHKTVFITAETLQHSVTAWLCEPNNGSPDKRLEPVPVLIVALHACGTLTPDIFRTFLALHRKCDIQGTIIWAPRAAVVVGCCYNLMSIESDFPLSRAFSHCPPLTSSHLQLATQTPAHWLDSPASHASAKLAVRKVAFRALLEAYLPPTRNTDIVDEPTTNATDGTGRKERTEVPKKRLGRLPDSAYASFSHFLSRASERMGVGIDLATSPFRDRIQAFEGTSPHESFQLEGVERQLEVLHVLRCIIGPCVESLILMDRVQWLQEGLQKDTTEVKARWDVQMVGLFDQAAGSARNFALAVTPDEENMRTI
ncbi:hypothetical protein HETIRDRAFT_427210 [Heterobasidion irregulare TC 32-1]|uniref:Methyltransferase domain-containing protein n=1 Tax=Heterobasidion irregulare (strain TC 32-1) TaxID=747525 RepID=W4K884_HETIT|nr:uncharacterized protein HETIRDRAFT_427210 [Heterobasidion irregulare TC 32-1]ETW82003.1 hypothetical protein HETIRDRAFT_427210 [Heterobasidion irregulare TC 32-1]